MASVRPPKPTVLVGQRIAQFVVVEKIGEGGMGIVYKATDERLRRTVALKILPPESVGDADRKRRFVREARAAAAITHPNIAAVHEVGDAGGFTYIAMEHISGVTLREHVARGPLEVSEALRVASSIARALAKAHAKGIVHRDLKPDNVMIDDDGEVKVLDFGLAKLDTEFLLEQQDTITMEGRVMGTLGYMSPEQATGAPVDLRADIYALGVILYEMLAGERPFHGMKPLDVLVALSTVGPPSIAEKSPDVPAEIDVLIRRCLAKEPSNRPSSADELRAELDDVLGVGEGPRRGSLRRFVSTDSASSASRDRASQLKTIGVSEIGSSTVSKPKGDGRARWLLAVVAGAVLVVVAGVAWMRSRRVEAPLSAPAHASSSASGDPEARALFQRGWGRMRGGQWRGGCQEVAAASDRDTAYAQAALLAAFCRSRLNANSGRTYYDRGTTARKDLAPPEAAVLDALETVFRRYPADWSDYRKRLAEAAARFPSSPLVTFAHAQAISPESFEDAITRLDAVIALDPEFARPLSLKAEYLAYQGKIDAARAVVATCLERFPAATDCLAEKNELDRFSGDARAIEADARRAMMTTPDAPRFYDSLANAMLAQGGAVATVEEILRQKRSHMPPDARPAEELTDGIHAALVVGDFERAARGARDLEALRAEDPRLRAHAWPALVLARSLRESGAIADAVPVARTFLAKRDAWEPDLKADDWAMAGDPTGVMLSVLLEAGSMTGVEQEKERASWLHRWENRAEATSRRFLWFHAWTAGADTPALARAAMDARARYEPIPPLATETLAEADVGHAYLLAGRNDEAITALGAATRSVSGFEFAFEQTRAFFDLGQAHERANDNKSACAAYEAVLARWRAAKPRSITVEATRKRMTALACGR